MEDLSGHLLDIVENAVRVGAKCVWVELEQDPDADRIRLCIRDDGPGIALEGDPADPFVTTKREKAVGLGLSFLRQAALEAGGRFEIKTEPGKGTAVEAVFRASHPDCKPLGDLIGTLRALFAVFPEISFHVTLSLGGRRMEVDTEELRARLNGQPFRFLIWLQAVDDRLRELAGFLERATQSQE
jgi:signal transduction histidine kinase